jgi:hypothetical protein
MKATKLGYYLIPKVKLSKRLNYQKLNIFVGVKQLKCLNFLEKQRLG